MWAHPGKKLLFMGCELGQETEWNHDDQVAWHLLEREDHAGVQRLVRDLNRLYAGERALHAKDSDPGGFEWIDGGDAANSIFSFIRKGNEGDPPIAFVLNMTPRPHHDYRLGLPHAGRWTEIFNTDAAIYGGSDRGNGGAVEAEPHPCHGRPASAALVVPPLGAVMLRFEGGDA